MSNLIVPALVPRKAKRKTLSLPAPPPGDKPPPKKRGGKYEPGAGTVLRGTKLKLYPRPAQAETLDLWRRRCRTLWNLLLGMEQAAYSGERFRSELGWREIWAEVAQLNHELALDRRAKRIAEGKEAGKDPVTPDLDKILMRGPRQQPRLFLWENDLQKLMARLKQVPHTRWIGELPSHAAQHVVKDLIKALQAMLREKRKRAAGTGGRDTGFPRFKGDRYASGTVYFANTQLTWDHASSRVKFPGGVGWIKYAGSDISAGDKFMGARAWRQGEDWWLSPQFEVPTPEAPPFTGRQIGVKVAAGVLATVYDGKRFEETMTPAEDRRAARRLRLWNRRLGRRLDAQGERRQKIARRKGVATVRTRRSSGFYEASARIARIMGHEANQRNDLLHKVSRTIVNSADHITIERLDVAGMMERPEHIASKRERRRERRRREVAAAAKGQNVIEHKAPHRVLRKALRRAAVARLLHFIKYKAGDGARTVTETHELYPRAQECRACGTLNATMKDGRPVTICGNKKCGAVLHRNLNAADNIRQQGVVARNSGLEAAE